MLTCLNFICVWCWHRIIDMAEKEETEDRCPACRTRYDKDRIVKMAATCDRSVVMLLSLPIKFFHLSKLQGEHVCF
jgi:DNA-directed RNA polymerase subunit RPC12/RpoP